MNDHTNNQRNEEANFSSAATYIKSRPRSDLAQQLPDTKDSKLRDSLTTDSEKSSFSSDHNRLLERDYVDHFMDRITPNGRTFFRYHEENRLSILRSGNNSVNLSGSAPRHPRCFKFPHLLHLLLDEERFSHIISWQPHGRAFSIKDRGEFINTVMPL